MGSDQSSPKSNPSLTFFEAAATVQNGPMAPDNSPGPDHKMERRLSGTMLKHVRTAMSSKTPGAEKSSGKGGEHAAKTDEDGYAAQAKKEAELQTAHATSSLSIPATHWWETDGSQALEEIIATRGQAEWVKGSIANDDAEEGEMVEHYSIDQPPPIAERQHMVFINVSS